MKYIKIVVGLLLMTGMVNAQANDKELVDNLTTDLMYVLDDYGSFARYTHKNVLSEYLMNKKDRKKVLKQLPKSISDIENMVVKIANINKSADGISNAKARELFKTSVSFYEKNIIRTRDALLSLEEPLKAKKFDEATKMIQAYYRARGNDKSLYEKMAHGLGLAREQVGLNIWVDVRVRDPKRSYLSINAFGISVITQELEKSRKP